MKFEIAIQAYDYPEPHRAKAGDIIVVRQAVGAIGKKEQGSYLWITIDVSDVRIVAGLNEPDVDAGEKRRFSIPLQRLKSIMSSLDLERVANPKDNYQPFVSVSGSRMTSTQDVPLTNLINDKRASRG